MLQQLRQFWSEDVEQPIMQDTLKDTCRVTAHELTSDLAVILLAKCALITLHTFVTSPKYTMLPPLRPEPE